MLVLPALAVAQQAPVVRFTVTSFEVLGPNPLSEADTRGILQPFTGSYEGVDALLAAAEALQSALAERGHGFHRVVLPPQTLDGETVVLEILVFKLGERIVEGNRYFSDENVLRSLPDLRTGEAPNPQQIGRGLDAVNRHPAKDVSIKLRESEKDNAIDAVVTVKDRRPFQIFGGLNNIGTDDTGRTRLTVGAQYSNLFNLDHSITGSYTTSPENVDDVEQYGFGYNLPLYIARGFLSAFYSKSDVDTGEVDGFSVSGAGRFWGLTFTRLLQRRGRYSHEWSLGIQNRFFENNNWRDGLPRLSVIEMLEIPGFSDVRSFPVTVSYAGTYMSKNWNGSFSASYSRNLAIKDKNDGLHYRLNRFGAETDWDALRFDGYVNYFLPRGWLARALFDGQWSDDPLISGEQFGLGGWRSIRGLDERAVTGDSGVHVSLEAWTPAWPQLRGLRFLAFVDLGYRDREQPLPGEVNSDTVSSAGAGARWQWRDDLSVSVDYGHTIAKGEGLVPAAHDEEGVKWHFNIFYRF